MSCILSVTWDRGPLSKIYILIPPVTYPVPISPGSVGKESVECM